MTEREVKVKGIHNHGQFFDRIDALKIKYLIKMPASESKQNLRKMFKTEVANSSRSRISNIGSFDKKSR
jgi:hypothetical protein